VTVTFYCGRCGAQWLSEPAASMIAESGRCLRCDGPLVPAAHDEQEASDADLFRVVIDAMDALNRCDHVAFISLLHDDFRGVASAYLETRDLTYAGHQGGQSYAQQVAMSWREGRIVPDECRALGGGRLVVVAELTGRSGQRLARKAVWLVTIDRGRILELRAFGTRAEAMAAVGSVD
jgi:ketosteroid isomerase-like protein